MDQLRRLARLREERGFTLAELLVVAFIMALFILAVGNMISSGVRGSSASYILVKLQERGNEALSVITRQLREAVAISPTESGVSSIRFCYLVPDEADGSRMEEARYDVADGFLRRKAKEGPEMENWIEGCRALEFKYWVLDDGGRALREVGGDFTGEQLNIMRVDVSITLFGGSLGGPQLQRTFAGSVTLRNNLQDIL